MFKVAKAGDKVHGVAAEHCHQFQPEEPAGACFVFARLQDAATNATSLATRHDEHGPDPCCLVRRIEQSSIPGVRPAAGIESSAPAPASAADDRSVLFCHEIREVAYQIPIEISHEFQQALHLPRVVRAAADPGDRFAHHALDLRDVLDGCVTQRDCFVHQVCSPEVEGQASGTNAPGGHPISYAKDLMNAYILIGGRSRRMGSPKRSVPFEGSTFLERVLGAARGAFDEVFAVQRAEGEPASGLTTLFEDSHESEAPVFGVAAALRHAQEPCFVLAVDYPLLTSELLCELRRRFEQSGKLLLAPRWSGKVQMLCAGYSPDLLSRIESRIGEGRLDLRSLADESEAEILREDDLRQQFAGEPLSNINTPEELEKARRLK